MKRSTVEELRKVLRTGENPDKCEGAHWEVMCWAARAVCGVVMWCFDFPHTQIKWLAPQPGAQNTLT